MSQEEQTARPGELKLPDGTDRVADFADLNLYYMSLERDKDGTVYLVSWVYQRPTVMAVIKAGGSVSAVDWSYV